MGSAALEERSDRVTAAANFAGRVAAPFGGLRRYGRPAGITALILVLGFLSLYPMLMLLYGSLHSTPPGIAGEFNLNGYISIAIGYSVRKPRPRISSAIPAGRP